MTKISDNPILLVRSVTIFLYQRASFSDDESVIESKSFFKRQHHFNWYSLQGTIKSSHFLTHINKHNQLTSKLLLHIRRRYVTPYVVSTQNDVRVNFEARD